VNKVKDLALKENSKQDEQGDMKMRFMMMTKNDPNHPITPPSPEMFAAMDTLIQEMTKAGVLLATGGLAPNLPSQKRRKQSWVLHLSKPNLGKKRSSFHGDFGRLLAMAQGKYTKSLAVSLVVWQSLIFIARLTQSGGSNPPD
jgi:hypothetical protein